MARTTVDSLTKRLRERLEAPIPDDTWNGPQHMAAAAGRVAALLAGAQPEAVDIEQLTRAANRLADGRPLTEGEVRLCCRGATTPVAVGRIKMSIADDER